MKIPRKNRTKTRYFAFVAQIEGVEFYVKVCAIDPEKDEHRALLAMQEIDLAPYGAKARRITKKRAEELKALNLIPFENFAES